MDLGTALGLILTLLTVLGGVFGAVKGYGALQERAKEQAKDLEETRTALTKLEARVVKAEEAAIQTGKLADAVEHMGQRFAAEIQSLGKIWSINHEHTREQLADIKGQLNRKVGE